MKNKNISLYKALLSVFAIQAEKEGAKCFADAWKVMQQDVFVGASRSRPGANNGMFQFLVDSRNTASAGFYIGDDVMIDQNDGKSHVVSRKFFPRTSAQTENGVFSSCGNEGTALKYKTDMVKISKQTVSKRFEIDLGYLRCIMQGTEKVRQDTIREMVRLHLDLMGRQVAAEAYNHIGSFARGGGNTCKDLPLLLSNGLSASPMANVVLNEDMLQADLSAMPVLIGGSRLSSYRVLKSIASPNLAGFDVSAFGQEMVIYRDTNWEKNNPNRVVAVVPGALKLRTTAYNKGNFEDLDEDDFRSTIVDPWYGITHDIFIYVDKCIDSPQDGKKYYMQIVTSWEIIGYPVCWSDDEDFNGVTDVYCYNAICSDEGACGIDSAESPNVGLPNELDLCNGYSECDIACAALFVSFCSEKSLFFKKAVAGGTISSITINGMVFDTTDGPYDVATEDGANGLVTDLQSVLKANGSVYVFSGGWNSVGMNAEFYMVAAVSITTAVLNNDAGVDIDLTRNQKYLQNVTDQSTPSTDATITSLNWITPAAVAFAGLPTDSLIGVSSHYGVMGNFFAEVASSGVYQLTTLDSKDCQAQYSVALEACEGLNFPLTLTAFDDANDNDVQDVGELGLANIKLKVWLGAVQVELVDEIVTDASGFAAFSLEAGTYNVTVDATYGAAIGRLLSTTLPKYVTISVAGVVAYGPQWTANGLVPIGPVV